MRWDMLVVPLGMTTGSTPRMADSDHIGIVASDSRAVTPLVITPDNNS